MISDYRKSINGKYIYTMKMKYRKYKKQREETRAIMITTVLLPYTAGTHTMQPTSSQEERKRMGTITGHDWYPNVSI